MADPRDKGLVNNLIAQFPGWRIEPQLREEMKDAVVSVFREERAEGDRDGMKKSVDILMGMAAMDQKDAHMLAKLATEQASPVTRLVVEYKKPEASE
jgi:hypothetical protein